MDWTFMCQVEFWSEDDCEEKVAYHAIRANSFAECAQELEDYYGKELTAIKLTALESTLIDIGKEMYEQTIERGF